ncbi:hypothetical protein DLREEDagrD3_00850 [Denitratisoma sp. agr-D3]
MFALRKTDMRAFTPDAQSVCRIEKGSTNSYLLEPRAIEDFLRDIEPRYNEAVKNVVEADIRPQTIYVLAGFIAYVLSCSPAGMRIQSGPLKGVVEETTRMLDAKGEISAPPPALGATSLADLLGNGKVRVEIDPKYPQAIGIASILQNTNTFGNFAWEILVNETDSLFFTSDFPIAIEPTADLRIINRIVPLTPRLAMRLHPDIAAGTSAVDFSFKGFRRRIRRISREEVVRINTLLVRCAESTVFFSKNEDWVERFVRKNSSFRIESRTQRIPYQSGSLLFSSLRIEPT